MNETLHIITPSARPQNLVRVWESIKPLRLDIHWWVVLDLEPQPLPVEFRKVLPRWGDLITFWFHHQPTPGAWGHPQRSAALDFIRDGWVWTLDDDNLCHPAFGRRLVELIAEHPGAGAFVVAQDRADGRILHPSPEELRPEGVDTAQYVIRRDVIGDERVRPVPADDGGFVQRVYQAHPDRFVFIDEVLVYHNRMQVEEARGA